MKRSEGRGEGGRRRPGARGVKGIGESCCNTTNQSFHLWRAKNPACVTEEEAEGDLEGGDGLHVDACWYSCMCASPCERYVVCVGVERG